MPADRNLRDGTGAAYTLTCQYAPPGMQDVVLRLLASQHPWIKPNRRVGKHNPRHTVSTAIIAAENPPKTRRTRPH